jgi:hypothetical protein
VNTKQKLRREELEEAILEAKVSPAQAQEMRVDLAKRESAYLRRRRSRIKIKGNMIFKCSYYLRYRHFLRIESLLILWLQTFNYFL